jgi:hypothetical protein
LATRLAASKEISDANLRQSAFAKLALDAAVAGDAGVVKECLDQVSDANLRENTKIKAVLKLGQAGKTDESLSLAKTISDGNIRERIINKIARGDYSE